MSDVKQVKVDNWGIYFLQRLKHFFNRTDYCDLTLQFQDNAQLKVHRLVLSACTEYFELLERTCEMYEDCLVMPDDLQADVVVPIVNFMYTGHLEFRMDLLERLYQTSQILNMPVLSKLLESHRVSLKTPAHSYSGVKRFTKSNDLNKSMKPTTSTKRSYSKAFDSSSEVFRDKKVYHPTQKPEIINSPNVLRTVSPIGLESSIPNKKSALVDPRPTRYEVPEELDSDNLFDNSFCNISYECKPLMIHPETVKRYSSKHSGLFSEASSSKKLLPGTSTVDIVECKRINKEDNIFDDSIPENSMNDDIDIFQTSYNNDTTIDSNQLFDQILDDGPKVTIETKDSKAASNLDHAKIISEVLKKYPHLVKSNKKIKLKILNTPGKGKKQQKGSPSYNTDSEKSKSKIKAEQPDYTYETDVLDSQQAAKLIAMGAENTKGPWICLICGTPGKALHFTSYYKFRRHLVEVHNEKPVSNICEYCGLRSLKRNYLLHHLYSQHGVEPPPQYHFPKCNKCNYIALTEGLLVKHKLTHKDVHNFRCNLCSAPFSTTKQLLQHIQTTGHKYSAERKTNLQCIYCLKAFLHDRNLYAHLKTYHKKEAKKDGIIEDSDDDKPTEEKPRSKNDSRDGKYHHVKFEPSTSYDIEYEDVDVQYQIQQRPDGDIQLTPRKQHVISNQHHNAMSVTKQKILNPGFSMPKPAAQKPKPARKVAPPEPSNFLEDMNIPSPITSNNHNDEIVLIDNTEYIMRDNQLIPRKTRSGSNNEFIISEMIEPASLQAVQPTTSMTYTTVHNSKILEEAQPTLMVKKSTNINQPIQIVVSNEEEYKALMSSNHPILFDNGDANKTLTVLTTQHNATMETATIDLDNTQSNDMMIIQEDFPLNVTEAVSSDNNIVVVYSHPVDDQNKQFQILTTGGIGSQFVQSSAIITQNYETVTTTAPVVSAQAHVLETQPDTTWQSNIQNTEVQEIAIEPQAELLPITQNVVQNEDEKPISNDISDSQELPEVHLEPIPETIVQGSETNDVCLPTDLADTNPEQVSQQDEVANSTEEIEEEPKTIAETPMETDATDILNESLVEQEASSVSEPMQISLEPETTAEVLGNEVTQEPVVEAPLITDSMVEQAVAEATGIVMQEDEVVNTSIAVTDTSEMSDIALRNTLEDSQPLPESQAYDDIVQINHDAKEDPPQPYTKEAEVKIQNLTSEWSEDEYDVPEAPATDENIPKVTEAVVEAQPEPEPEILEETIENIQQEIQNHVSATTTELPSTDVPLPEIENEESENSIPEDIITIPQEEPQLVQADITEAETDITETQTDIMETQTDITETESEVTETEPDITPVQSDPQAIQKISSLLNDWEDNDSQEESVSDAPPVEEIDQDKLADVTIEKIAKPDDNIKSLVSDWDDEEEEAKESNE